MIYRWRLLGFYLRPRQGRHCIHDPSSRSSHRHAIFCTSSPFILSALWFSSPIYASRIQTDPCGLQIFHLLSHTDGTGGASLLVDGFYAASILRELHPSAFDILSRVRVPTHAAGEPGEFFRPRPNEGYPILNVDEKGRLVQVRYNNDDRSVMTGMSSDEMEEWCANTEHRVREG